MAKDKTTDEDVKKDSSSSTDKEDKTVETTSDGGDKEENFAKLRDINKDLTDDLKVANKKVGDLEIENEDLKADPNRTLDAPGDTEEEEEEDDKVVDPPEADDTVSVLFKRDLKEATKAWNKDNDVSATEWAQIQKKVTLKGDETQSEIAEKIEEAYQGLPSVREKRDKAMIDKGRKQADSEFSDEEMGTGTGGDVDLGGERKPRFNRKTKDFAKKVGGMSDKELAEVDPDGEVGMNTEGPEATRKFFEPGT